MHLDSFWTLSCCYDLCVCFYASIILLWVLQLGSFLWNHMLWCVEIDFFCSRRAIIPENKRQVSQCWHVLCRTAVILCTKLIKTKVGFFLEVISYPYNIKNRKVMKIRRGRHTFKVMNYEFQLKRIVSPNMLTLKSHYRK